MGELTAYGKTFRDWEALLGACEENLSQLPGVEPLVADLTALLSETRALKILEENLAGRRRETAQKVREMIDRGRESARKIRSMVRSHLGTRNERLAQYGVAPIRRKPRRTAILKKNPPAEASPAESKPVA